MPSDLEERLLSFLREHPGSSPREIADALGEPLQRIRAALARLRDRGLVARGEEGRYYAVAPAVRGIARSDVRREASVVLRGDLNSLIAMVGELARRLEALEERLGRLEDEVRRLRMHCRGV